MSKGQKEIFKCGPFRLLTAKIYLVVYFIDKSWHFICCLLY